MLNKYNNLFRVYQEEAGDDGAPSGGGGDSLLDNTSGDSSNQDDDNNESETPTKPDFLLDKYLAEGRSMEESIAEQAKGYGELQKRFGAFTGSPEEFELSLSDELKEAGAELSADDPLVQEAMKFAKESNMSQEGFNGLVNLYVEQQVAEAKALTEYKAEQMKELGSNAQARIENISQWGAKNLDGETFEALKGMATSAESVKAIEQLISKIGNGSVDPQDAQNNSGFGVEELRKMQFEKDEHGNRKIQTDPEFRKRYNKLAAEVYPGEHRQIVG